MRTWMYMCALGDVRIHKRQVRLLNKSQLLFSVIYWLGPDGLKQKDTVHLYHTPANLSGDPHPPGFNVENNIKHHKKRVAPFGGSKIASVWESSETDPAKVWDFDDNNSWIKIFLDPFQSEERNEKWSHHRIFTSHEGEELVTTPLPPESMLKT